MDKRKFLKVMVNGAGFITAGLVAIPGLISALSPAWMRRREPRWQPVGPLADFPAGTTRKSIVPVPRDDGARSLRQKGVYVWRPSERDVVVFSRNCTDLSCPVSYDPGSGLFFCPCHGGIFAQNGEPMAGPPSRPLYRYATRLREGVIEIDLNSLPPMT